MLKNKNNKTPFALIAIGVFILCCSWSSSSKKLSTILTSKYESIEKIDTLLIDSNLVRIQNGEILFNSHCQTCHATGISHYKDAETWSVNVARMGIKANLADEAIADLDTFVIWKLERTDSLNITPVVGKPFQW